MRFTGKTYFTAILLFILIAISTFFFSSHLYVYHSPNTNHQCNFCSRINLISIEYSIIQELLMIFFCEIYWFLFRYFLFRLYLVTCFKMVTQRGDVFEISLIRSKTSQRSKTITQLFDVFIKPDFYKFLIQFNIWAPLALFSFMFLS